MSSRIVGLTLALTLLVCAQCGGDGGGQCGALPPLYSCRVPSQARACTCDADCKCGTNTATQECEIGRAECIDASVQCPDHCTGLDGTLTAHCDNGICQQVTR